LHFAVMDFNILAPSSKELLVASWKHF